MRLSNIKFENYGRLQDREIEVREHLVLVGANDVGKSSLLRMLDLTLGASMAQLYANLSVEDLRKDSDPLIVEVELTDFDKDEEGAFFPDEIKVDPVSDTATLTVQLRVEADEKGSVTIQRFAPSGGTNRQLSREQIARLGWKFLGATAQSRDLREDRRSAVDDMLEALELGDEQVSFTSLAADFQTRLNESPLLSDLRSQLAGQLSKALPEKVDADHLSFVSGASADDDPLSDVRLQVIKSGETHNLSEQSDGTRALYAIALYDLMSVGANIVAIDEPEIHLHPTSQRSLARLLRSSASQKILATHSPDIVSAFDPGSVVVVRHGGELVQPKEDFLSDDEKMRVRWWVRDRLEPLTSKRVIAVEGISDRIILERAAEVTGRDLDRLGASVVEAGGANEMAPIEKLFGESGFNIRLSVLVDEDAEESTAKKLGLKVEDLASNSVWVSRKDLEDEYVAALGVDAVWNALTTSKQFTKNQLQFCESTGEDKKRTAEDVAAFCRRNADFKVRAALSITNILTVESAVKITSIENLLSEIVVS
ncbi:ATP-dependent nuclease [Leucobacter chinensis]|uniref:ATP-dependent nuclease n=1 Tax=Leucobacter chinensis TaxID=2851010 RepID=UPI001C24D3D4|nr:AAA family ATPase [Leucobacter chinensis]